MESRLHVALRIEYLLGRRIGSRVDAHAMLSDARIARETLLVCLASGEPELEELAEAFYAMPLGEAALETAAAASPQDVDWAQNTSGFGVTQPPGVAPPAAPRKPRLLQPSTWFGSLPT